MYVKKVSIYLLISLFGHQPIPVSELKPHFVRLNTEKHCEIKRKDLLIFLTHWKVKSA